jgi:hypothetical protein
VLIAVLVHDWSVPVPLLACRRAVLGVRLRVLGRLGLALHVLLVTGAIALVQLLEPLVGALDLRLATLDSRVCCVTGPLSFEKPALVVSDRSSLSPASTAAARCDAVFADLSAMMVLRSRRPGNSDARRGGTYSLLSAGTNTHLQRGCAGIRERARAMV